MTVERARPGGAEWAELAASGAAVVLGVDVDARAVAAALVMVYGTPRFNVGICRHPLAGISP